MSSPFPTKTKNHSKAPDQPEAAVSSQPQAPTTGVTPFSTPPQLHEIINRAAGKKPVERGTWLRYFNSKPHAVKTRPPMSLENVVGEQSSKVDNEIPLVEVGTESFGRTVKEMDRKVAEALRKCPPKPSPKNHEGKGKEENVEEPNKVGAVSQVRIWNLRPRKGKKVVVPVPVKKPTPSNGEKNVKVPKERFTINVALSTKQIEDDILTMTGLRPTNKPQTRPKDVQSKLEILLPGNKLVGISIDSYNFSKASLTMK